MTTRAQIVSEARSWLGTRYHHQAQRKGVATDCIGLVYGVGENLGLLVPRKANPVAAKFEGYRSGDMILHRACEELLHPIPVDAMRPGDVYLMVFGHGEKHVGILGDLRGGLSLIHAYAPLRRVVEGSLDAAARRTIVAAFAYPGIAP